MKGAPLVKNGIHKGKGLEQRFIVKPSATLPQGDETYFLPILTYMYVT